MKNKSGIEDTTSDTDVISQPGNKRLRQESTSSTEHREQDNNLSNEMQVFPVIIKVIQKEDDSKIGKFSKNIDYILQDENNDLLWDPADKANLFAKKFLAKRENLPDLTPAEKQIIKSKIKNLMMEIDPNDTEFTEEELERVIQSLPSNKSLGMDGVTYDIIKNLGPTSREFLLRLYNTCLNIKSTSQIRIYGKEIELFFVKSGVNQGCVLSPILVNCCIDWVLENVLMQHNGAQIGENLSLTNLDYADDVEILSDAEHAQKMLDNIVEWSNLIGLKPHFRYSGHIEGEDVSNMVLFAGTVFQEILIWSPTLQNSSATCRVLHRLKGHQGVIFSLAYCQKRQLICSTSDDRSIRTWKVDFSMCDSSFKWEDATIVPHLVLHGHSARVWRSLLLEDVIVSAGEDSFICLWSYEGELLDKWQSHDGASVRCIDYSEDTKLLYSSGDDGGVFAWRIEERKPFVSEKLGFPSNDAGHPSNVIILPSGELLVIDSNGIIFKKVQNKWTQILNDFKVENATLVKAGEKYFCLGKMVGDILFYFLDDLESDKLLSSIYLKEGVVSLHWVDKQSIVVCGRHGILNLIMLSEWICLLTYDMFDLTML
ncbi:hypothetical protein QYM36_013431, partial [Artemia franciscana]